MPVSLPKDLRPSDPFVIFSVSIAAAGTREKGLNDSHRNVCNLWQRLLESIVVNTFPSFTWCERMLV